VKIQLIRITSVKTIKSVETKAKIVFVQIVSLK